MMAAALVLLALGANPPGTLVTVTEVRLEAEGDRPAVRVVVSGAVTPRLEREGRDLVLVLPGAVLVPDLVLPGPLAEVRALSAYELEDGARLRIRVDGPAEGVLSQEGGVVSVTLRAPLASPSPGPSPAPGRRSPDDVRDLYARIVPVPPGGPATDSVGAAGAPPAERTEAADESGLHLGPARIRPYVGLTYVDADIALLDTPQPVHDRYFQVEPHLPVDMGSTATGRPHFQLSYDPRFRFGSSFDELGQPSHLLTANLDVPMGPSITLKGGYHFAHGLLETTEVDPGREYFFQLSTFTRHQALAGVIFDPGGVLALELNAMRDSVDLEDESSFFDHHTDTLGAGLAYEIGARSRAYVRYSWIHVPTPPERPEAESTANTVAFGVSGDLLPLVTGEVWVGLRSVAAPQGGPGGTHFGGSVLSAQLRKEFSPGTSFTLLARRDTYPSDFEENAFYVASGVGGEGDFRLPLSLVLHAALGWQRNAYQVASPEIAAPRRDDLVGWSIGVGRALTSWSYLRTDYRRDHRDSNLPVYNSTGYVFTVQVGLGYLGSTPATGIAR